MKVLTRTITITGILGASITQVAGDIFTGAIIWSFTNAGLIYMFIKDKRYDLVLLQTFYQIICFASIIKFWPD